MPAVELIRLAREALQDDGQCPHDCALLVSSFDRSLGHGQLVRLAYDAPHTYGKRGARWYQTHHALPRRLSQLLPSTVHAYVLDPDGFEEVCSYGGGRRVGGERLDYDQVELPEDDGGEFDERAFEKMKARWPLGHLAQVLSVTRDLLARLPRAPSTLLPLDLNAEQDDLPDLFGAGARVAL